MDRIPIPVALLATLTILLGASGAAALPRYKVDPALSGTGSITGVVSLEGAVPEAKTLKVTGNDVPCHKEPVPDESLVVSRQGKVRWAVVSIKKIA